MSKRTVFTTITPLPQGCTREVVVDFLHNHLEMIDLNPLVKERHPIKPPAHASPEEFHCIWYSLTDKISYLPGGLATGDVNYTCAFHDISNGVQTHCYAPMGLDIRDKWTLCGSLPGEPVQPVELGIGAPITGLYLREDIDMKCNMFMTGFVKKNLKRSHGVLVDRLKVKAQIASAANLNHSMSIRHSVTSAGGTRQGLGSPDPNQYPARPSSVATTGSGSLSQPPPPTHSPDPNQTQYSPSVYGTPPANYSQPAQSQGPVTWQSLKASASVSSHYNPAVNGRTPSFVNQQQPQYPQHMDPYAPAPLQLNGQPAQHGYQQYQQYQQYNQQQQYQQQYHPQQNGSADVNQQQKQQGDVKHNQNNNLSGNTGFVAELE